MANAFTKSEQIFFEQTLEAFGPANITAKNCKLYEPPMESVERSGLTVRRPAAYIAEVVTGLDVSAAYKDLTELTVPSSLATTDILNHPFKLDALSLNDPTRRKHAAIAAAQALSAKIDTLVSDKVSSRGTLVLTETGEFSTYDHLTKGETALMEREVNIATARCLILNPKMARKMGDNIAGRANLTPGAVLSAYERSQLPGVGGFETLRANVLTAITGSAIAGVTVNGANQRKTPTVFDGTNDAAADNRTMTLNVSAATYQNGDCFTIAGVNSVGMITKKDTGRLQTFRVISGGGTAALTISPAIIPIDQATSDFKKYGNVTTTPANGAACTIMNTATTQPSIFFVQNAVEITHGRLAVDELGPTVAVMRERTDSGVEIIFARQGNVDDFSVKYRLTCWAAPNVIIPEMAGIYLPNQAAAFG